MRPLAPVIRLGEGSSTLTTWPAAPGLPQLAADKDAQTAIGVWITLMYTSLRIAPRMVVHTTRSVSLKNITKCSP